MACKVYLSLRITHLLYCFGISNGVLSCDAEIKNKNGFLHLFQTNGKILWLYISESFLIDNLFNHGYFRVSRSPTCVGILYHEGQRGIAMFELRFALQ